MNKPVQVFVVLRHDGGARTEEMRLKVTVVAVLPTLDEAVSETERLSRLNSGSEYFWQSTRWYPQGRDVLDQNTGMKPENSEDRADSRSHSAQIRNRTSATCH